MLKFQPNKAMKVQRSSQFVLLLDQIFAPTAAVLYQFREVVLMGKRHARFYTTTNHRLHGVDERKDKSPSTRISHYLTGAGLACD